MDIRRNKDPLHDSIRSQKFAVGFAVRDEYIDLPCHSCDDTWFNKEELKAFKLYNARCVQLIYSGNHRTISGFCERGLEDMPMAASLQMRSRRSYAKRVVLDEQKNQRENLLSYPELIAATYSKAVSRSVLSAVARGLQDAKAAN